MDPTPSPTPDLTDPWFVSPGIEGFLMFFVVAVATILLIRSMLKHVRKANFRAAEREEELYGPAVPGDAVDAGGPESSPGDESDHTGSASQSSGDASADRESPSP